MAKAEIKGLKELLKKFKTLDKEIIKNVDDLIEGSAQEIEIDAKVQSSKTSFDLGKLTQGIKAEPIQGEKLGYKVVAKEKYSAFMEFGTGGKNVKVPPELKKIAWEFKGDNIREGNITPRPFLYPAFVKHRKILIKDLKDYLKTLKL